MILYDKEGNTYSATKTKPPKTIGRLHRGRFLQAEARMIDDKTRDFFFDIAYGTSFYFQYEGQWYRLPFFKYPAWKSETDSFEVKEFFTRKQDKAA